MRRANRLWLMPLQLADEILTRLALLADGRPGHSLRAISRELQVPRDAVRAIARGHLQTDLVLVGRIKKSRGGSQSIVGPEKCVFGKPLFSAPNKR